MKKFRLLLMLLALLTAFNGCQKEEPVLIDNQLREVVKPDVYVENGYLVLKNMDVVDSVISLLNQMTRVEKESWEKHMGFKSARTEFDALFDEYEKLKSYEEFLVFKERNKNKLKFNVNDENDCSIDYPYATKFFIPVLNNKGICKIGETIMKYTQENQFAILDGNENKLNNLNAYMDDEMIVAIPQLKSITLDKELSSIHAFPEDNPKGEYNPWHRKPEISNRKLKNELYYERYILSETEPNFPYTTWYKSGVLIYLNQRGQKISWGSWVNYKTEYGITKIICQAQGVPERSDSRTHRSAEVTPSVNFHLYNIIYEISTQKPQSLPPFPSYVHFAADVTFRGFGFNLSDYYTIETPENYVFNGGVNYPSTNWGW